MMILSNRKIPKDLLYYRALQKRMKLDRYAENRLEAFEKGYAGELLYDSIFDEIISHLPIFRDIYLNIENSIFQCDALIVYDAGFIVNEIKNFRGIYTYENEKWYVRNNEISEDPIIQLKRATSKLIKLRYLYNLKLNSIGKVIFPNPEFYLQTTHPTVKDYTIVRHELRHYLHSMNSLKSTQRAFDFTEIIQQHIVDNPYFNNTANLDELKHGVYCRKCNSFNLIKSNVHFHCLDCRHKDTVHTVIVQALSDFNILFTNNHITRNNFSKFLGHEISQSTINRYLQKYCIKINSGPSTCYKFKYYDYDDATNNESRLWRFKDNPLQPNIHLLY